MVKGLDIDEKTVLEFCETCVKGKQHHDPLPNQSTHQAKEILKVIHSDVCGPMKQVSISRARYFVTFIDDKMRKMFTYLIKSKDEMFEKFKDFKALVKKETEKKIKTLHSNNSGKYTSQEFECYLKDQEIKHQKLAPYIPEQNGMAEQANHMIIECT